MLVKPGEYVITESIKFNRLHDLEDPSSPPEKNIIVRSEAGPDVTTLRSAGERAAIHTNRSNGTGGFHAAQ